MIINLVPDVYLRKLLLQIIIKTRNGVLPVIPLIPTDFFCFLWWRSHTMLWPLVTPSLIDVGSASLQVFYFLCCDSYSS